jgi:hypothetical protein
VKSGTRELKRSRRAVPSPVRSHVPWGCLPWAAGYLGACLFYHQTTGWVAWPILAGPVVIAVGYGAIRLVHGLELLWRVDGLWVQKGIRCLIVHSHSPIWEEHIHTQWLPRFGPVARQLNWSERASWPGSLEVSVFRRFCLAQRNFNPAVLVFRGYRAPLVFRFFYAFHEARNGRPQYLQELEAHLFDALGVERGRRTSGCS